MGEEGMEQVSQEWEELIKQLRTEMDIGTDPASEKVQKLAAKWKNLIEDFTGGDPEMRKSLDTMYKTEGHEKASLGYWDNGMSKYLQKALSSKSK